MERPRIKRSIWADVPGTRMEGQEGTYLDADRRPLRRTWLALAGLALASALVSPAFADGPPPGSPTGNPEDVGVVAPVGTVAEIWLYEPTVKTADVPLKSTSVAPVNALPVIETELPTGPLVGAKPAIFGFTLNSAALVAFPPGVSTSMGPVVAPEGTFAVIFTSETTAKAAATPVK